MVTYEFETDKLQHAISVDHINKNDTECESFFAVTSLHGNQLVFNISPWYNMRCNTRIHVSSLHSKEFFASGQTV